MNREIKFRAWETNKGLGSRMSEPFTLVDLHNKGLGSFGDTYIFMQFTGLTDKNNKEIYEGDIVVKHYDKETCNNREADTGIVKWVDFGARFTLEIQAKFISYCELYENLTNDSYPRSPFEVIGNI